MNTRVVFALVGCVVATDASLVQYKMVDSKKDRCQDAAFNGISSLGECAKAAAALKLPYRIPIVTGITYWDSTPKGCYLETRGLFSKGLWFNPNAFSTADGSAHGDKAICAMPDPGHYAIESGAHKITSFDGTAISADFEHPLTANATEQFPLIVFSNSWVCPEIEYLIKTIQWAKLGYVMVEYQSRGWYESGGLIDTAGPDDMKDSQAVIDWALKTFPHANPNAVAVGGVSYGAGIALLAAAMDKRVKAVLALSGWSDLYRALNWQETPALAWGNVLEVTGELPFIGREPQVLRDNLKDLMDHKNMSFIESWAGQRSPMNYLDKINENKPAIYMSHQHTDNLFHSSLELEALGKLNVPKHLDLNQGTHASAEIVGLAGLDIARTASDHIWNNALLWMDHFLKGVDNGAPQLPLVQMQLGNDGIKSDYVSFSSWPPAKDWSVVQYSVGPRQGEFGTLSVKPAANLNHTDTISFNAGKGRMTTGIILVSDFLKDVVPIKANLADADPTHSIIFTTGALSKSDKTRVCGTPRLTGLTVVPTESQFQVVAYLYDLDISKGTGRLITHSPSTVWDGAVAGDPYTFPAMSFHTSCFEVAVGHAVALGINMYDNLYKPANTNATIVFKYEANGAPRTLLELPIQGSALPDAIVLPDGPQTFMV